MKFITKEIEDAILKTPYGSTDGVASKDKKVIAKFFNPYGVGTWFVIEDSMYKSDKIVFGAVDLGYGVEIGDFSIKELEELTVPVNALGMHAEFHLERDTSVKPFESTLGELMEHNGLKFM